MSIRLIDLNTPTELDARYLKLAGGTMTGNLLFTDNTLDIGASDATRPRTGYFGTSLIVPTIIGGTGTTSDLNLKTTSGIGAVGADMHFLVVNNGATEAITILNDGNVGIGTTGPGLKLDVVGTEGYPVNSGNVQVGALRLETTNTNVIDFGVRNAAPWGGWIQVDDRTNLSLH